MISNEALVLFTVALMVALLTSTILYQQVQTASGKVDTVARDVTRKTLADFTVVSVDSSDSESNIYVSGISGEVNLYNSVVIVDGNQYTPTVTPLNDSKHPGLLDPGDLYVLTIPTDYEEGQCLRVYASGTFAIHGLC